MRIISAEIRQFRNIQQLDLQFHPDTNLILGENAQGKTSLLETFAYLSVGSSHRASHDRELVTHGQEFSVMKCLVAGEEREYTLEVQLRRGKRRRLLRNQVAMGKMQAFSDVFQTVMFCPEDLVLVRGASLLRRRFLDRAIAQLRPQYGLAMEEYKRLYQHKLQILKNPSADFLQTLPDFNLRMAQTGTMVIHYRAHFIKRLQEVVPPIHHAFSGGKEEISLVYQTVSTVLDPLAGEKIIFQQVMDHQASHYQAELASGKILTGPHKDDLGLYVQGQNAKLFASQGQTRTLALSLKLGEREIFHKETGEYPVLLLDDVLSELDRSRQEFVLNRIQSGQVFITSCEDEMFLQLREGAKFSLRDGCAKDLMEDVSYQEQDSEGASRSCCGVDLSEDDSAALVQELEEGREEPEEALSQSPSEDIQSQEKGNEGASRSCCEVDLSEDDSCALVQALEEGQEEPEEALSQSPSEGIQNQEKGSEGASRSCYEVNLSEDDSAALVQALEEGQEEPEEASSQSPSEDIQSQEKGSEGASVEKEEEKDSPVLSHISEEQ